MQHILSKALGRMRLSDFVFAPTIHRSNVKVWVIGLLCGTLIAVRSCPTINENFVVTHAYVYWYKH